MTKETVWIEQFTGLNVTTGADVPRAPDAGPSVAEAALHFEKKRLAQRVLLAEVREKSGGLKLVKPHARRKKTA